MAPALLLGGLSSAFSHLVEMTADLLFGAAQLSKSLLNLLDARWGFYWLVGVVVLFHVLRVKGINTRALK